MLHKLFMVGVEHRAASIACLLALTVLASLGVPKVRIDTGFERLISDDNADRQTYRDENQNREIILQHGRCSYLVIVRQRSGVAPVLPSAGQSRLRVGMKSSQGADGFYL